jgi:uncharacterized phiE125 gp8 family phage protein
MSYTSGNHGYLFMDRRRLPPAAPVHSVVTAPASPNHLAVSVADMREHLGYGNEVDAARDAELTAFILAAQANIEQRCDITIMLTVFRADFEEFADVMPLAKRPYVGLTSIQYVDPNDGEITTASSTLYHVAADYQQQAKIYLGQSLEWPAAATRKNAVRVTYSAGWTPDTVQEDLKLAIKMLVAKYDANRGDCDSGGGGGETVFSMKSKRDPVDALLDKYKLARVIFA